MLPKSVSNRHQHCTDLLPIQRFAPYPTPEKHNMSDDACVKPEHAFPALLTIKQTAKHMQVSTKTIRRWIKSGDLVAHRFGRQWRISKTDLQTFIRMRREA